MKITKKLFIILAVIINILLPISRVNAANILENKSLERGPLGYYCVQKWNGSKWIYLTYNTTYYTDNNKKRYVAYCLSPGNPGVGYVSGEKETYNVQIKEIISDERVWRIIKNGYPYKTIQELNVETVDDAYFATMQAVNCILRGYSLEQVKELYSPGKFAINGEDYEEIQRRGNKTLNAMYELIQIGLEGKEKREELTSISIKNVTDFIKENDNLYSQTFKVESKSVISQYSIENLENLPNLAYIADINGNKKSTFSGTEYFKIIIPKTSITEDINGKITIKASQKNYPIYFGTSELEGYQNYALCSEENSDVYVNTELKVKGNKSKLSIIKVDSETNNVLEGVKFQITNSNGEIKEYTTDRKGKIELTNLYSGKIKIKEIKALDNYIEIQDEQIVELGYDETKEIKIENSMKKGNLKVIKVDYDNNEIRLKNVKFQLKDVQGNIIKEDVTNENGEILFENFLEGKYVLTEVETQEEYIIQDNNISVEIENAKTKEVVVKNKKIPTKEITVEVEKIIYTEKKELPKTGKNEKIIYICLIIISLLFHIFAICFRKMQHKQNKK